MYLLLVSILSTAVLSACDKDTKCYLDVKVYSGNTSRTVSGAKVQIYQHSPDTSDDFYTEGRTGSDGVYSTDFAAPGIFKVNATLWLDTFNADSTQRGCRKGNATVRLAEGETNSCNVRLSLDTAWDAVNR
ncbi:MAG: hypothetical protein IJU19_00410 [Bacteroidales bacterium]|nr:hypothetical protein [Bacteroidales bacterium]